ncbi:MAG: molybdopterin-synthase adenylyltransferase MoeB [Rhodobacteraceae bacterium]|nr:molybdopterin-synthase adenylyltransferase MoeB [Paracoccaceae bacterium]
MIWVLLLVAFFWGLGHLMKVPTSRRLVPIGLVIATILLAHLTLPPEHPLVLRIGGSFTGWAIFLGALAAIWAYAVGVAALKARARNVPGTQVADKATFSDAELDRYARHIVLREIGGPGQKALKDARVLVVGAGGLGSPALLYMAAAGVGTIGVVDDDVVDNSNLQRQVIHRDADIGKPKVFSAEAAMCAQNPAVNVRPYHQRLDEECAKALFTEYDLILEGSDNFTTKYLVNRVAAKLGKPVIGAAISQWEGQISTWDPKGGGPCYQCVFPEAPAPGLAPSCSEAGVIGPLPGVMGSMMAVEVIKELSGAGDGLRGRLLIYDALYGDVRVIRAKKRDDCPVCGDG